MVSTSGDVIRIAIASPLEIVHVQAIASVDPLRARVLFRPDLLPPIRYRGDHNGPPEWTRTEEQRQEWEAILGQADVLWDLPAAETRRVVDLCPRLRWIQTTSAGVGPAVLAHGLDQSDVIITTASGIHAQPLAEFVFAALLYHVKAFPQLLAWQSERRWQRYCGNSLAGRTLTVVGPGRIGREILRVAKAFRMQTIAVGPATASTAPPRSHADRTASIAELPAILPHTDDLVLCCPLTPATRGLIDREALAALRPGATLVNIARGPVVDEQALIEALRAGHLGFAALDVFDEEPLPPDSPLWTMPNVLISPHSASTVAEENRLLTERFIDNLQAFLDGRFGDMGPRLDPARGY